MKSKVVNECSITLDPEDRQKLLKLIEEWEWSHRAETDRFGYVTSDASWELREFVEEFKEAIK